MLYYISLSHAYFLLNSHAEYKVRTFFALATQNCLRLDAWIHCCVSGRFSALQLCCTFSRTETTSTNKNNNFLQCSLPLIIRLELLHKAISNTLSMTWLSWISHCIIFQMKNRNNDLTDYKQLCCLLFGYFPF